MTDPHLKALQEALIDCEKVRQWFLRHRRERKLRWARAKEKRHRDRQRERAKAT